MLKYSPITVTSEKDLKLAASLVFVVEARDTYTAGHLWRTASYSQIMAERLNLDKTYMREIIFGALLHDFGKAVVPDSILNKPGKLDEAEWQAMASHPTAGLNLLEQFNFSETIWNIIGSHHEKFDGTGYPNKLIGDNIPLEARIVSLADSVDAITSARPYRPARSLAVARSEIEKALSKQFCEEVGMTAIACIDNHEFDHVHRHSENNVGLLKCPECKHFSIQIEPHLQAGDLVECRPCTGIFSLKQNKRNNSLSAVFTGDHITLSEQLPSLDNTYVHRVISGFGPILATA